MARTQPIRPSPKAEALGALRATVRLLEEPLTPFLRGQLSAFVQHASTQVEMIEELARPRKAKLPAPVRPAAAP